MRDEISGEAVFGSAAAGVVIGFIGLYVMKTTENRIAEMMVLITTGYGAFWLSEHFFVMLKMPGAHWHMHLLAHVLVRHLCHDCCSSRDDPCHSRGKY